MFAQCCFGVSNRRQPFASDRFEVAKPHRWAALTKCDKIVLLNFVSCVTIALCVFRGRRNTLEACRNSWVGVSWQAQHFVRLHRRFSGQAQHFLTGKRYFAVGSQWQGCANVTRSQNVAGQHLASAFKSGESFAKFILFELCKNSFITKTRRKSSIFSFKVSKLEEVS